ncbi:MAG TPA: tRNA (adenosine(37)-N6)-threonylcarbamoyltransferase complex ATPase subunit type 1 TsaE [Gemmataceae bacterium]|jgi:tRNA threonylcarbamoyladenosine biosynthesis protein TsaE|nr:tRNA (adenosine(37)-N6)-threonylcarbamoyltransferase complex ATPase subunit type 1 TsaE [Gemmataceae bacterium]
MSQAWAFDAPDIAATVAFGHRLAGLLFPGAVVALIGPLGAGKTHLVRAVAEGLGCDRRRVSSPTFALVHEYPGRMPIYHFDTYRLPDEAAFADLGVDEYFASDGICLIEWADRVEKVLPAEHLRVAITPTGDTSRRFEVEGRGERYGAILRALDLSEPRP